MSKKVSVVVPIFNAKKYLETCLTSIQNQSYKNIEIILVNDGSTDGSDEICEELKVKDARINVVNQENRGPAAARNRGIEIANGTYIQFVDADDQIKQTMIENLVSSLENTHADLAICGYETINNTFLPSINGYFDQKTFLNYVGQLYKEIILPSPCNKMYRLKNIKEKHIRFPESYSLGEDLLYNLTFLQHCSSVYVIEESFYMYQQNQDSLTNTYTPDMYKINRELYQKIKAFLSENNSLTAENHLYLETIYSNALINSMTNLFHRDSPYDKEEQKKQLYVMLDYPIIQEQLPYFTDSRQAKIISYLIRKKSYENIYFFMRTKEYLRHTFKSVFRMLKRLNAR